MIFLQNDLYLGGTVAIPVFLTNVAEVEAFQLVIRFDPGVLKPEGSEGGVSLEGGFFEGQGLDSQDELVAVRRVPDRNDVFVLALIPHQRLSSFQVPPGQDRLVFSLRAGIAAGLEPGVVSEVALVNGAGEAGFGELKLRNELSSHGKTRLPRLVSGSIRTIEGRILLRGDSNHDGRVDVSDGIFALDFLFLGGRKPQCADAADANDDGKLDLSDAVAILSTLFLGVPKILPPFPSAGVDPTPDDLPECL